MATVNVDTIKLHEEYKRETGFSRPTDLEIHIMFEGAMPERYTRYVEWLENKVNDLIEDKKT